jgi:F-type H+-transporting ATPase subunit epsilon
MKVDIITPGSTLFSGDTIHLVQLPGIDGSFEIMNHHAPLISVLKNGKIKVVVVKGTNPQYFEVKGGVVEVQNNKVLILAE